MALSELSHSSEHQKRRLTCAWNPQWSAWTGRADLSVPQRHVGVPPSSCQGKNYWRGENYHNLIDIWSKEFRIVGPLWNPPRNSETCRPMLCGETPARKSLKGGITFFERTLTPCSGELLRGRDIKRNTDLEIVILSFNISDVIRSVTCNIHNISRLFL